MSTLTRNQIIASAAGTLEILEALGNAAAPVTLTTLVTTTGRPKGTVHRMLSTLVNTGYARQDAGTGRYSLTLKAWRVGASALADLDLVKIALPVLDALMQDMGETVHLAVLDPAGGVVYVAKIESARSIRVQTRLGQVSRSWCTATGRSMLAFDDGMIDRVLAGPLQRLTPKTVTDPRMLRDLLAGIRAQGFAVTLGENHPEMGGVAAPIRDHAGEVVAACGVAIPAFRMDDELVRRAIPLVVAAAGAISRSLGHCSDAQGSEDRATRQL